MTWKLSAAGGKIFSLLLPVFFIAGTIPAVAQQNPGTLDPDFNSGGKIIANLGNSDNIASAAAVQPDGKILVAGLTGTIDTTGKIPGSSDFVVLRYNPDGTPDNTFDGDGKVVTSFGDGEDGAGAILIQPDGKILVAGAVNMKTSAGAIALARYHRDGSLDATFDGDGKVSTDVAEQQNVEERAEAMILQPDGKIVVVVSTIRNDAFEQDVFVVRYNTDGSRDFTFAGDGITTLPWAVAGGKPQGLTGSAVASQPDGKIVVGGTLIIDQSSRVFVWRINPNGTDDETFGGRAVTTSFNNTDNAVSGFVQPDSKIVVAGWTVNNATFNQDFAFARFDSRGNLDPTFDSDGKKTTAYDDKLFTIPLDFALQPDGKIVSVGTTLLPEPPFETYFAVTRLTADGNLDPTFDGDGKVVTNFSNAQESAFAVTIQKDGKIIAAGTSETGAGTDNFDFAIARYTGDSAASRQNTEFDFDGDGRSDAAVFRPTEGTWLIQPSGANDPNNFYGLSWGMSGDKLAPADYDGDGKTDTAIWRESEQNFYILNSSNNAVRVENFGLTGDVLTVGDWDGDGKADPSVFRGGAQGYFFYRGSLNNPHGNITYLPWGTTGDKPVRGDYDGDGKTDAAVYRPADSVWYILQSSTGQPR